MLNNLSHHRIRGLINQELGKYFSAFSSNYFSSVPFSYIKSVSSSIFEYLHVYLSVWFKWIWPINNYTKWKNHISPIFSQVSSLFSNRKSNKNPCINIPWMSFCPVVHMNGGRIYPSRSISLTDLIQNHLNAGTSV